MRVYVDGPESYLATSGASGDIVATPDHASLDITGDMDVRIELTNDWDRATVQQTIMGKWSTADGNRSWIWRTFQGQSVFVWSPTGLSAGAITALIDLPQMPRRAALRGTLDVNNGAGGWTFTLYWADTLDGPWNLIGTATGTGTTSVYSGTAPLEIAPTQVLSASLRYPWRGRLHRAELRSGIGGSVVAGPDVRALAAGTTSWADSAGRTWTVGGAASITTREYRLHAEVSSWPARWDTSGKDVWVPVEAAGILRRLGQGKKALASTLARRLPSQNPVAYWPMEDGRDAVQAYSPIVGCEPLVTAGFSFGQDDSCPGSAALPSINAAASMVGAVPAYTSTGNGWLLSLIFQMEATPPSVTQPFLAFRTSGTTAGIVVKYDDLNVGIDGYDSAGGLLFAEGFANDDAWGPDRWFRLDFSATQNGGNVDFHAGWVEVDGGGIAWNWSEPGTVGNVTRIETAFGAGFSGLKLGHLAVFPSPALDVWGGSDNGYGSEAVSSRIERLGGEEGVPITAGFAPTPLGPQRPGSLLALLSECEAADGGVLYEEREDIALRYRPRQSFYSQPVALTLDYTTRARARPAGAGRRRPARPQRPDHHPHRRVLRPRGRHHQPPVGAAATARRRYL